jgi:hypothetical protein
MQRLSKLSILALVALTAGAQTTVRRLANGKPDFNGVWQAASSAHYDIERHMARHSLMLRDGPHGPLPSVQTLALGAVGAVPGGMGIVEGGKIPYKPEALKMRDENRRLWIERDPEVKCYLPGIPRANYMPFPFQIVQNAKQFFFAYEYAGAHRDVLFQDPGPAETDSWMGQAVGRWEGDTLVIENSGFNDQTWFDRAGNYHSNQLRVVERFKLLTPYHIQYDAVITDPEVFTGPWKIALPLYRRMEKDARLMDFRCVEFVEELIYGEHRRNPLKR